VDTALIRVDNRSFPIEITVTDAQYVYRDLPEDVRPGGWWGEPFFQNLLPEGVYIGKTNVQNVYNRFCYDHFDFAKWEFEHPVILPEFPVDSMPDSGTDPDAEPQDTEPIDEDLIYGGDG